MAILVSFLLAITILGGNCGKVAIAHITPTANPMNGVTNQNASNEDISADVGVLESPDPIRPRGPPIGNLN